MLSQRASVAPRSIAADVSGPATPHSAMPLMLTCAGRAEEGLRADWQGQLALVQREIGFHYLRFHGLLSDDMGLYHEDAKGRPFYTFAYVDELYDAMRAQHIRPFVELSFMPSRLAAGERTIFWWKANVTPPRDLSKWNGLVRALVEHLQQRYGTAEVAQWYFEVWNEPDLPAFWTGTAQDYLNLYRNTAETIKTVCPTCRVGGPASAISGFESIWLSSVTQNRVPADFLSTHAYGVVGQRFGVDGVAYRTTGEPITRVRESHDLIANSPTPSLPLFYTEWNSRYTEGHPIHDQYISAAFILNTLRQATGLADAMGYWTFTDLFEEDGPLLQPFHGGFGLLTVQGIRKPAYFAYRFLAQLGPEDVASSDPLSWVTRKQDGSVQVLFWDYTPEVPPPGVSEEQFYRGERPTATLPQVRLRLDGMRNGRFRMSTYVVGHANNDAYTAYLRLGSPPYLDPDQFGRVQAAASGAPLSIITVQVTGHRLEQEIPLHQNDSVLVVLEPVQ